MKVAFSSTDGTVIDQHFGMAREYWIWDVGPETARCLGRVSPLLGDGDEEDRTAARADAVAGCAIVYCVQIGGPAAAKLVGRRVHPMKTGGELPVSNAVAKLQEVLRGHPPPWLRRAMGGPEGSAAE